MRYHRTHFSFHAIGDEVNEIELSLEKLFHGSQNLGRVRRVI